MRTPRPQAPGIRQDGEANRALRRAYLRGEKFAIEAVQVAANRMGNAVAAIQVAFGGCYAPPAPDTETEEDAA